VVKYAEKLAYYAYDNEIVNKMQDGKVNPILSNYLHFIWDDSKPLNCQAGPLLLLIGHLQNKKVDHTYYKNNLINIMGW